jgi:hypothetical protein
MRAILGVLTIAAAVAFAGPSSAVAPPTAATAIGKAASPINATVIAQRCRCVEKRWNGSCKLRVCKDNW